MKFSLDRASYGKNKDPEFVEFSSLEELQKWVKEYAKNQIVIDFDEIEAADGNITIYDDYLE